MNVQSVSMWTWIRTACAGCAAAQHMTLQSRAHIHDTTPHHTKHTEPKVQGHIQHTLLSRWALFNWIDGKQFSLNTLNIYFWEQWDVLNILHLGTALCETYLNISDGSSTITRFSTGCLRFCNDCLTAFGANFNHEVTYLQEITVSTYCFISDF